MTSAIIFDADGMLIHGERFSNRLERDFGIGTDIASEFFGNEFQECLVGKADLKEELAKYVDKWNWDKGVDALIEYWFDDEHNVVDEKFKQIIKDLREKDIKCYLATNNEKYRTDYLTDKRGLGEWFDKIFSSAYIGYKKPDPEFFQSILDESGVIEKINITYWDDDEKKPTWSREIWFSHGKI